MAVFNTNQVRHLYVTGVNSSKVENAQTTPVDAATLKSKPVGTIYPVVDNTTKPTKMHLVYKGFGGPIRSDLIDLTKATYYTIVDPAKDKYTLKAKEITLKSDVNGGNPVAGQDYILGIEIKGFASGFEEDTYTKQAMVHAYSSMNASAFYNVLAYSLWMNFSRETTRFFSFWLKTSGSPVLVDETKAKQLKAEMQTGTFTTTATGIIIQEAPMEWSLGRMQEEHLYFNVSGDTIVFNGDELEWATVANVAAANIQNDPETGSTTIPNSHRIADLEYFCMGERGDIYRNMGWPNTIFNPASLLVDPTNTTGYFVFNLHFAFTDSREGVQRSEKDLQIVANSAANLAALKTVLDNAGVKEIERKEA